MYSCYTSRKNLPCPVFSPLKRSDSMTFLLFYIHVIDLEKLCQLQHSFSEQETNFQLINQLEIDLFSLSSIPFALFCYGITYFFMKYLIYIFYTLFASTTHTTVKDIIQIWNKPQRIFIPKITRFFQFCSIYNLASLNQEAINRKLCRTLHHSKL